MSKPILALLLAASLSFGLTACKGDEQAQANLGTAEAFMAKNATAEGVKTLPSGLQYKVIRSGPADGIHPRPGDEIKVHYEGALLSGEVFDSSYQRGTPADFPLEGLIPAWVEALQLMRPGDQWMLYVPPKLGYGNQDKGPIPGGSLMIFKIELIGVLPHAGGTQLG